MCVSLWWKGCPNTNPPSPLCFKEQNLTKNKTRTWEGALPDVHALLLVGAAPRVGLVRAQTPTCRSFPFSLGWQPLPRPLAKGIGVVPAHLNNRVVQPLLDAGAFAKWLAPVSVGDGEPPFCTGQCLLHFCSLACIHKVPEHKTPAILLCLCHMLGVADKRPERLVTHCIAIQLKALQFHLKVREREGGGSRERERERERERDGKKNRERERVCVHMCVCEKEKKKKKKKKRVTFKSALKAAKMRRCTQEEVRTVGGRKQGTICCGVIPCVASGFFVPTLNVPGEVERERERECVCECVCVLCACVLCS